MAKRPAIALDPSSRAWSLVAAGACQLPLLLQLPAGLAISLAVVAALVALVSWRRPLPGWLRGLLALALVGGVLASTHFSLGRDTGCALLAAMLALKPAETASLRDGRSLIGFAIFAPFATFLLDQGPLSLALGLIGVTLALAALLRLAELESGDVDAGKGTLRLSPWRRFTSVWRMVAIGLPLALAAFWLFPRLAAPLWGVPDQSQARPGLSDEMEPGSFRDILTDDTPALRAQFFGQVPVPSQLYWRGTTLWNFDGRRWTRPEWMQALPRAKVRSSTTRWDYQIDVEPTDHRQLVALDLPTSAPQGTRLSVDYGLMADKSQTTLAKWQLHSSPPTAFESQLDPARRRMALELPRGYNPRTLALGQQWRQEAGPSSTASDAAIVQRALDMVRAGFGYTLAVPLPGRNAVDEFLFDQKEGYCEQFSSSFVVLMRAAGIPARVVTGYAGGYYNRIGEYWLVRRSDAHAWAEAWLPGRGWVRADPTAAVSPERIYDTLADRIPGNDGLLGGIGGVTSLFDTGDWLRRGWNDFILGFNAARQRQLLRPLGVDDIDDGTLLGLFGGAALLALLWMLWLSARAEREADPMLRAWHRLAKRYARIGLAREPHEPATRWAGRVSLVRPDLAPRLQQLTQRFNEWRYAGKQSGRRQADALLRDLRRHRPGRPASDANANDRAGQTNHGDMT